MPLEGVTMKALRLIKETVQLRDGRKVVLRPIRPEDAALLMDLHSRLSTESQYLRFFGPKPQLTMPEAEYLAGVDFHQRFAIVATVEEDGAERIVAVGRFDVHPEDVAEPAIVVRDDYQGTGLGTAILRRMMEVARGRGVEHFRAEILAENSKMIELLRANGIEISEPDGGVVNITAPIEEIPLLFRLARIALRFGPVLRFPTLRRRTPQG